SLRPGLVGSPHLLDVVKGPRLWTEDMDNYIASVDQNPIAQRHPFNPCIADAAFFQLLDQLVGDRANVALGAASGDNHIITKRRFPGQVYADNIVSLGVLKCTGDEAGERGGSRSSAWRAVRSEFGELLFQRIKPQREDPSFG